MQLKWYLIIIIIASIITSIIVSIAHSVFFFEVLLVIWIYIILVIIIDGIIATICRILPKKVANYQAKLYLVSKREKQVYDKIKIKSWKEKVPEIGHFTGFRKNKIDKPKDKDYINRFLEEICYGEVGHAVSILTGFCLLLIPLLNDYYLPLVLVVAIVNGILNLLPIFVLRYNSYTLLILHKRLARKEE